MKHITGKYNALAYTVFSNGRAVYSAGNSACESQCYLPARKGVGVKRMGEFCLQMVEETVDNVPDSKSDGIEYAEKFERVAMEDGPDDWSNV